MNCRKLIGSEIQKEERGRIDSLFLISKYKQMTIGSKALSKENFIS